MLGINHHINAHACLQHGAAQRLYTSSKVHFSPAPCITEASKQPINALQMVETVAHVHISVAPFAKQCGATLTWKICLLA